MNKIKLALKDQSSAHEKQRSTIKRNVLSARTTLFPAVFKENISVFNFLFSELVISKFKFAEYIRKTSFDR